MEINRSNVMEVVTNANLKPDKDYGQNFLLEPEVSKKIVDLLQLNDNDVALEIGPGIGSLSHFLSLSKADITLVDIDRRMVDFLNIFYKDSINVKVVENDIRKHNVSNYTKVLGNLPYNITTELVTYLLFNAKSCSKMVLMCQTEAFNRFNDISGKDYGPVSVLIHLLGSCKKEFMVKPGSFYPVPKCNSTVFTINVLDDENRETYLGVYKLAKEMFLNRRKTIHNNLTNYLKNREKSESILLECGLSLTKRPEEISPKEFLKLYQILNAK